MRAFSFSALLVTLAIPCAIFSQPEEDPLKEAMIQDLHEIQRQFEFYYAPVEWKQSFSQWSLLTEVAKAEQEIRDTPDIKLRHFHRIVKKLFNSAKDYHVDAIFYRTESADLPFEVRGADGHYYLMYIDRHQLPESSFPFHVGDEIVTFDGRPTAEVVEELRLNEARHANQPTDEAMAQIYLTFRQAAAAMEVPSGPITLGILPQGSNQVRQHQLIWNHIGEAFRNHCAVYQQGPKDNEIGYFKNQGKIPLLNNRMMGLPHLAKMHKMEGENPVAFGGRQGFLPTLGRKIWESDDDCPFNAYISITEDRYLIGYIRIPHYVFGEYEAEELAAILGWMQDSTDGLILDQMNNHGGAAFFLYGVLSMLTDQPLDTPRHRFRISQEDVAEAFFTMQLLSFVSSEEEAQMFLGPTLWGYPVTYQTAQFLLHFCQFIMKEWNDGKELTRPYYMYGVDQVNPHPEVQYTQPILVLINELDFSAADFLPAILQDNKRALLMGARTAGAGGIVSAAAFPNRLGIEGFTLTNSLAERVDKDPIENHGVTPDVPYEVTPEDLQTGFRPFADAILTQMARLINEEQASK